METISKTKGFTLPQDQVVMVTPILERARGMIKDKNHEAFFLFGDSKIEISVKRDSFGQIVCPLTEDERAFFEDKEKSGLTFEKGDLSPYSKKWGKKGGRSWWETKEATITLRKTGLKLNIFKPMDYIRYKILLSNSDIIAPSGEDMLKKATYIFALTQPNFTSKKNISLYRREKDAIKLIDKISSDREKMIDVLLILGKKVAATTSPDELEEKLFEIAKEDPKKFTETLGKENLDIRITLLKATAQGIVKKSHSRFFTLSGEPMNLPGEDNNLEGAIDFLASKANQELYLTIKAELK